MSSNCPAVPASHNHVATSRRKPPTRRMTVTSTCCAGASDTERLPSSEERLSLFKVALGCEAAAGLGCGIKAKPILLGLARVRKVEQAWLSRDGTMLAVLWADAADGEARDESVRSLLFGQRLAAQELSSAARAHALQASADAGWYRAAAIDRLSEEESAVIAARLVRRVTEKVRLSNRERQALSAALAEACRHELVDRPLTSASLRRRRIASAVLRAGRRHLEGAAFKALQEAAALGHRLVSGER